MIIKAKVAILGYRYNDPQLLTTLFNYNKILKIVTVVSKDSNKDNDEDGGERGNDYNNDIINTNSDPNTNTPTEG